MFLAGGWQKAIFLAASHNFPNGNQSKKPF
jgi:hypothetical protein